MFGSLEGDFVPVKPIERRTFDWRMHWRGDYYEHADLPVVFGAWWRDASDRRKALVAVNLTDESQSAVAHPPVGCSSAAAVTPVKGQSASPSCESTAEGVVCRLPPRTVGIFVFSRNETK